MSHTRRAARALGAAALLAATAGCNDFLTVENPNVIDVNAIDPVADAATLAGSAQQNFAVGYGWLIMYSSWLTGETLVSETFPTRNEFGTRTVQQSNGSLNTDVWQPLSLAAASSKLVLDLTLPTPTTNVNYARAALWRGYSFVLMAEMFCSGTVDNGPELTTAAMLDSAVAQFTSAITIGTANGSADAQTLVNAARVGRARAHLQAGRRTQAITDADAVPAGFTFNVNFIDDLGNRTRLSNRLWQFTLDRGSISVAPFWQQQADPRVPFQVPGEHALVAQDPASGAFIVQRKYPGFAAPIRVASKLEADYIKAEATGTAAQLELIQARRAANGRPAYAGPTDAASVLREFATQRGLEFYLEGKRLGDLRRLGEPAIAGLPQTGATYFKPGFPTIGNATCFPLPITEIDNNPNFRKTG